MLGARHHPGVQSLPHVVPLRLPHHVLVSIKLPTWLFHAELQLVWQPKGMCGRCLAGLQLQEACRPHRHHQPGACSSSGSIRLSSNFYSLHSIWRPSKTSIGSAAGETGDMQRVRAEPSGSSCQAGEFQPCLERLLWVFRRS